MPIRAKARLSGPRKRRTVKASIGEPAALQPSDAVQGFNAEARITLYAQLAWLNDYTPLLQQEAIENGAADAVSSNLSGYRAQQMRKSSRADAVFWQSALRISKDYERLKRERNVHYISFSQVCVMCAQSILHTPYAYYVYVYASICRPHVRTQTL